MGPKFMSHVNIHDKSGLEALFKELNQPKFRIKQFYEALYKQGVSSVDEITTFPKDVRAILSEKIQFESLNIAIVQESKKDDTIKFLLKTEEGFKIECVLMRHLSGRNTLCVSSQVGCPMGCAFCATGKMGLTRNLKTAEIVDQVLCVNRFIKKFDQRVTNVVFMGMGEPLLNLENVVPALDLLCNEEALNLSNRHVTISTCGLIKGILDLMKSNHKVNLAISLHSADQKTRSELMPVNLKNPLENLMEVLDEYVALTNRRVFYEYIMIADITDSEKMAKKLGHMLRDRLAHVNLIPYNQANNRDKFAPSTKEAVREFQIILNSYGVTNSIRYTLGDDIDAACGQLAGKNI